MRKQLDQFIRGALTPLHSLKLISNRPGLLTLSLAPVISAILIFATSIYLLLSGLWSFVHSALLSAVSSYSGVIFILTAILVLSAVAFFSVNLLTFLMSLLASPFNDMLAEKAENVLGVKDVPHWSVGRFLRVFWVDLRKSVVTLFSSVVFSLGMLVPVANVLFFIGLALLHTFTFITYPQSRREHGLLQSLRWIRGNIFLSLGFGVTTLILFSIPVVNFFALPVSVVGGTLLFCQNIDE